MDELDRERKGRPWPSTEERAMARQEAGLAAREAFEAESPLLAFEEWAAA